MSCVNWWTYCLGDNGCGHTSYTRYRQDKCEKCGDTEIVSDREWDEQDDYDREKYELTHIGECLDEYGDNCPEEEE